MIKPEHPYSSVTYTNTDASYGIWYELKHISGSGHFDVKFKVHVQNLYTSIGPNIGTSSAVTSPLGALSDIDFRVVVFGDCCNDYANKIMVPPGAFYNAPWGNGTVYNMNLGDTFNHSPPQRFKDPIKV